MASSLTDASASSPAQAAQTPTDALDRLTPYGERRGMLIIYLALTLSFVLAGYFVIYWRNADMDLMIVYSALAMNDGLPQHYVDHTGYLTIISVKYWFQLLHSVGLLDAYRLSAIPSAANVPAFDAAMTSAIRAGRVVSFLTTLGLVAIFAGLARRVFRDWRIAQLVTFAFAFSGGIAVHMRILRTELIAASLPVFALLILIIVARRASAMRPLWIGLAAALCVIGMENKVHAILLVMTLPALAVPFGARDGASAAFWRNAATGWPGVAASAAVAAVAVWLAWPLLRMGFDPAAIRAFDLVPAFSDHFGAYQPLIGGWVVACVVVFALIWRVSATETLATLFAIIAGMALALLIVKIDFSPINIIAVLNPAERMLTFAGNEGGISAEGGISGAIHQMIGQGIEALKRYTFVLRSSPRPTVFLVWLVLPGIVLALKRGERLVALQATMLMAAAFAIDMVGIRRGLKPEYIIFSDPLIILAGAVLLERMIDLRWHRLAYPIGLSLIIAHVAVSQAEPVKHVMKRSGPDYICDWNQVYEPLLPLPWCAVPPIRR